MTFYDHPRYGVQQTLHMGYGKAKNTSVIASRVEIDRKTMMKAVTIKDWNIHVIDGATCTGATLFNIAISKSLAGTGAVTPFGSQAMTAVANGTVVDASLTETNFAAGDDLVVSYEAGTALPAGALQVEADVDYVERYS